MPLSPEEEKAFRQYLAEKNDSRSDEEKAEDARLEKLAGKLATLLKGDGQRGSGEDKPKSDHWSARRVI